MKFPPQIPAEKWKKARRRVTGAALGAFAAASIAVGALFGTPEALIDTQAPPAIVLAQDAPEEAADTRQKKSRRDRLRAWVQRLPAAARMALLLPLWCAGRVLILLLGALWTGLSPLLPVLGGMLLNLLLVVGTAMLLYKLFFPDKPLRALFTKRRVLAMLACALLLSLADRLLPLFWADYAKFSALGKTLLTLAIPLGVLLLFRKRNMKGL